jgi:heme-degrading monooxygenase HmoA
MLTKVLIRRQFKSGHEKEIVALLNDLRYKAMKQPGYVSGITMTSAENPQQTMVIGTWESLENWLDWKQSSERKEFDAMLEIYQETPTEYEAFVVGSPFEAQRAAR